MARVPLLGGAYQMRSLIAGAQRSVNLFSENNPGEAQSPVPVTHYPTPGLRFLGRPSDQPGTPDPIPVPTGPVHTAGNTSLDRNAVLTGVADGSTGLFSAWFNPTWPASGDDYNVLSTRSDDGGVVLQISDQGGGEFTVSILVETTSTTEIFVAQTTSNIPYTSDWTHFAFSFDVGHPDGAKICQLAIDRVLQPLTVTDGNPSMTVAYSDASGAITQILGNQPDGSKLYIGDAYQVWWGPDQLLDLSVSGDLDKLVTSGLTVVDFGSDGSTPTGTAPAVFFLKGAPSFGGNLGPSGTFTRSGDALTIAASSPPGA